MSAFEMRGRRFEDVFYIAPPLLALCVAIFLARSGFGERLLEDGETRVVDLALGVLIHAHLVAVVFRSHFDRAIFRRHLGRFIAVPVALFALLVASPWASAIAIVVATFWDVYHSGAQTFGLARILDRNEGVLVTPSARRWDALICQITYAGPIAAGVSLDAHLESFESFAEIDSPVASLLTSVPLGVDGVRRPLSLVVLALGALLTIAFIVHRIGRIRRGEGASFRSTLLLASTAIVSLVSWGFDPWGEAFFVMNAFHAVQYLALVWATRAPSHRALAPAPMLLVFFLASTIAYGVFVELLDSDRHALWSLTMVVSLMHFWYDGFIWSVSRADV